MSGATKSCGCWHSEATSIAKRTHGRRHDRVYAVWCAMKHRAKGNYSGYEHVDMDPRWQLFEIFISDMGEPKSDDTIDRIDNSRGYWQENCRWVSMKIQQRNRTNNRLIKYNGKTLCVAEWSEILKIPYFNLYTRLKNRNWNMKKTLNSLV